MYHIIRSASARFMREILLSHITDHRSQITDKNTVTQYHSHTVTEIMCNAPEIMCSFLIAAPLLATCARVLAWHSVQCSRLVAADAAGELTGGPWCG